MPDLGIDALGNIPLGETGDFTIVTKSAAVRQALRIRLQFLLGEWWLDRLDGVAYREEILIRDFSSSRADREIRRHVLITPGVQSIKDITVTPDLDGQRAVIRVRYRDRYSSSTQSLEVSTP